MLLGLIVLGILLFPVMAKSYIKHKIAKMEKQYGVTVSMEKFSYGWNKTLKCSNGSLLLQDSNDTLFYFNQFQIKVDYFKDWKFQPRPVSFMIDSALLNWVMRDTLIESKALSKQRTLPEQINRYINLVSEYFPEHGEANYIDVQIHSDSLLSECVIHSLTISDSLWHGDIEFKEHDHVSKWKAEGNINPAKNHYTGTLRLQDKRKSPLFLHLFKRKLDMDVAFQELAFELNIQEQEEALSSLSIGGELKQGILSHPKLSDKPIPIDSTSFRLYVQLTPKKIEIDSSSTLTLNGFPIHPYFMYEKQEKEHLIVKVSEKDVDAKKFFKAIPSEIFQVIPKLSFSGSLDFHFLFDCDFAEVENLQFDVDISTNNLIVENSGLNSVITKYNNDVIYTREETGVPVREIRLSSKSKTFVAFENIPFYLRNAILISEDPSFFQHRGFIKSSIRDAMVTNLQREKFAWGGSTISMQLVKNLFLSKRKVASRKFEEMILVSLIENKHLISKERMFEIYVNIIEWAPNVYGLSEAARFYFNKPVDLLTFGESVYLATLIRSPKHFARTLEEDGKVTSDRRAEMHLIARKMLDRGFITTSQYDTFNSFVVVTR